MAPTPNSSADSQENPKVASKGGSKAGATPPKVRAPGTFTYKFVDQFDFDPNVEVNSANADFVGKSPGLVWVETRSSHRVPMRQFVVGDIIRFDLSELAKYGSTITVKWICRRNQVNDDNSRILMGSSNDTILTDALALVINALQTSDQEQWGMWAEITFDDGKVKQKFMTADPEGLIGMGDGSNPGATTPKTRAPGAFTYKFADLPEFDPSVEMNAVNADFVGKSPGLEHVSTRSPHSVPMRQLVVGDTIKFDLSELAKYGTAIKVMWICRQRHANADDSRILMGSSNDTILTNGTTLAINARQPFPQEHWGMWAKITLTEGNVVKEFMTADPEGVIGNGI